MLRNNGRKTESNGSRWKGRSLGIVLGGLVLLSGSEVFAQQHGHQQMMMPRVPADKLEEARALKSPLPSSPEIVEKGKAIYEGKGTCINCHGAYGRGDVPGAVNMNPPPRVFRSHGFWMHRTEGEIFWVIKHGSPGTGMIPFGGLLTDEEIWTVMQYERSFAGGPGGRGGPRHGRGGRHHRPEMMEHQQNQGGPAGGMPRVAAEGSLAEQPCEISEKIEKAKTAPITIIEAIGRATQHVPGVVVEAEFEVEDHQGFWEVEVASEDGKIMEVKVDSLSGDVRSSEAIKPEPGMSSMVPQKGQSHGGLGKEHGCCGGRMEGSKDK